MNSKRMILIVGLILLIISSSACYLPLRNEQDSINNNNQVVAESPTPQTIPQTDEIQPTDTADPQEETGATEKVSFDPLGITIEVPRELYVQKDPIVSYDDTTKLESYLFYIQNYGYRGGPNSGSFQMYGHLQYDLPQISWEEFAGGQIDSEMNAYVNQIEINGLKGLDTQLSGVRNRYVYHFYLDGYFLLIAVADPTEENKALADSIISTIQFNSAGFTSESHFQKVIEPGSKYQLYLPDDWSYEFGAPAGIRLSDLQASSADYEVLVEETDGPHSNIYHKSGVNINFVILEDDSAKSEPIAAEMRYSQQVMYYGIEMTEYVFAEPSTAEGEIRELRFYHNGLSYILRFSYSLSADQEQLDWIIRNIQIIE